LSAAGAIVFKAAIDDRGIPAATGGGFTALDMGGWLSDFYRFFGFFGGLGPLCQRQRNLLRLPKPLSAQDR
jgi:hypothetical protein